MTSGFTKNGPTRRRGRPPGSDSGETRDRILHAAREVFSAKGYAAATHAEIAEEAGVTRPAINHYYRSKPDLYRAVFESIHDSVVAPSIKQASETPGPLQVRLAAFLTQSATVHAQDPSYALFIATSIVDAYRHPEFRELSEGQIGEVRDFLRMAVRDAQEAGEVRPEADPDAVAETLVGVLWGLGLYAGMIGTTEQLGQVVVAMRSALDGDLFESNRPT